MRQEPWPRSALLDRPRRQRGLYDALLAARTGILRSHILPDHERRWHVVQLPGDVRTDAHPSGVARRAVPLAGWRHNFDSFAGHIGR